MSKSKAKLIGIVTSLVAEVHPDNVGLLASRLLDAGSITALDGKVMGFGDGQLDRLRSAIDESEMSTEEVGGMLVGASHAYNYARSLESVDLIWTGPSTRLVSTRRTEQALIQIIDAADANLFMTSFVVYDVSSVINALKNALTRSVSVRLLLESSEEHGGRVTIDGASIMRENLPNAEIYRWDDKGSDFMGGSVHAKVAVADESTCFISSANLTGHAMERNMEAGVMIRGGDIPTQLHHHLRALITTGVLTKLD